MKRLLLLFGAWMFLFSCTRDADENSVLPLQVPEPVSPYAVSESDALQSLAAVLQQIDSADETRAGGVRKPLSIRSVKASDVFETTRSADIPDLDNLFYVVSFGEGNGSAVLGADSRVEPVIAILDETVLAPTDFSDDACNESDVQSFMINMIKDSALEQAAITPIDPPSPPILPRWRRVVLNVIADNTFCAPRLKTKWGQGSPYNDKAPMKSSGKAHCPAGCSMIAMGQFLYYMQLPNFNINGVYYDWNLLKECEYGSSPSAAAREEVANFIYSLGLVMQANFGDDGTGAFLKDVLPLLSGLGFYAQCRDGLDLESAKSIVSKKGPVCITGYKADNNGHSWVIDGWDSYREERVTTVYNEANMVVSTDTIITKNKTLYHLNLGWDGKCDGYYSYSTFVVDTSVPLEADKVDTSIGDRIGTNGSTYVKWYTTFVY